MTSASPAPLTVTADPDVRRSAALDAVIASLPISLAHATNEAVLVAIDGAAGWSSRIDDAVAAGARGILLLDPRTAEQTTVTVPVIVEREFASNAVLETARHAVDAVDAAALLEVRLTVQPDADQDVVLLDALAAARSLTGSAVARVRSAQVDPQGMTARVQLTDWRETLITVTRTRAVASAASLRLVGLSSTVEVSVPDASAARPGEAIVTSDDGAVLLPTIYETAHRTSWRRLVDAVGGVGVTDDLEHADQDLRSLQLLIAES